VEEDQGFDTLR